MIRRYSDEDERRIRLQRRVGDWANAGLIDSAQRHDLDARLAVDLKRTNGWLRGVLGFFTIVVSFAVMGLVGRIVGVSSRDGWAVAQVVVGAAYLAAADLLAGPGRLYRYGVEEMLAASAVALFALGASSVVRPSTSGADAETIAVLLVLAAGGCWLYARFGLVYAAAGAAVCAGLLPFRFGWGEIAERTGAAAIFAAIFVGVRILRLRHHDEFPGDDYGAIQLAPLAGAYLALNLRVADPINAAAVTRFPAWFYWSTYAATWLIPIAALAAAIRQKDRPLLTMGIVLLLGTLATNKPYLGMVHESWDPMILGALLMGGAIGLRRWLAAAPGGQRGGYIATPILARDRELLSALATASVLVPAGGLRSATADPNAASFQGGRSGGGGGGDSY